MDNQAAEDYKIKQMKLQVIEAEIKGKAKGKAEGIEIGEARLREEKNMIARAMLLDGDSVEKIPRITGLSVEKINELKS